MGIKSRRKGVAFELVIRDHIGRAFKGTLPGLVVRRSSQAERAYEADVIIEGPDVPQWLRDLWVECQHADATDPATKYAQGLRDAILATKRTGRTRVPVVAWRKTGARSVWLTTSSVTMIELLAPGTSVLYPARAEVVLVTALLDEVLAARASAPM